MIMLLFLVAMPLLGPSPAQAQKDSNETIWARQKIADQGLFFALAQSDISSMFALRDQNANPNTNLTILGLTVQEVFGPEAPILSQPFNPRAWPILHWAVYLNDLEAVKLLLRSGARVNASDIYGATALHWAAWGGYHEIGKLLLNNKANCQARDRKQRTPKDWAIMMSQDDMVRLISGRTCNPAPAKDSDNDGVDDYIDLCPDTPYGALVDERGCWVVADASFFDFDRAVVKKQYVKHIEDAAQVLKNTPGLEMVVEGFTDSVGSVDYNLELGYRRAESVKNILVASGVDPNLLIIISRGEAEPAASNKTSRGRALNRRVELRPSP